MLPGESMDHDSKLLQYVLDTLNGDGGWRVGSLNQLVRVDHLGGDSLELGLLDLDDHPATYLLGFTAPPSWRVLGVVCTGFAGPMAAPGEEQVRPSAHPDAIRVRVVSLMARSGAQIGGYIGPTAPPRTRAKAKASYPTF